MADLIREITAGKPYVFMAMPFGSQWHLFAHVKAVVVESVKLSCIRADDIPGGGFDLLEKIHLAIQRAELVIAEITERNANVFYELGYAVGIKKPVLLIAQRGSEIPTDLRGIELVLHSDDKAGTAAFVGELRSNLERRMNSQIPLLRDMLEAERPQPAFIVASPKYPNDSSNVVGQLRDNRTFGDNLGVLGLLSAFGSIFGETTGVELVSGQYCSPEIAMRDHNLYVIGSPKVNLVADAVMRAIQPRSQALWRFGPAPGYEAEGNYPVSLYRAAGAGEAELVGKRTQRDGVDIHTEDFGIVIRGPHPKHPDRLLMVLAGAHSLGTGAACIAATRSQHVRQIRKLGIDIADRRLAFWVLVRGVASERDGLLDVDGVSIEDAGVY